MPDVSPEGEDGIAIGRGIVVGQHDAHLMESAEDRLSRRFCIFHSDDGFHAVPYLIFRGQSHDIFPSNDIRDGRLVGVAARCPTFHAKRIEFFPLLPESRVAACQFLPTEITDCFVHYELRMLIVV